MDKKPFVSIPEERKIDEKKELVKKLNFFLTENKISLETKIDFPQYRQLPEEVELALRVIENHKGKIILVVNPHGNESNIPESEV